MGSSAINNKCRDFHVRLAEFNEFWNFSSTGKPVDRVHGHCEAARTMVLAGGG
jgi:hypothetical protein